jgi:hypothetical protein
MKGPAVWEFIDWVQSLSCGVDLLGQGHYAIPSA